MEYIADAGEAAGEIENSLRCYKGLVELSVLEHSGECEGSMGY